MHKVAPEELKGKVREYWDRQPWGLQHSQKQMDSIQFFEDLENFRYLSEPEVFSFAQFTRFYGQKVLEVGVGVGTDFIQWVRAGAKAYGVDLSSESLQHGHRRLQVYGLKAQRVIHADVEALPFSGNSFDLVYSWGVIHHSPDTEKALSEIIRVCRPGGVCKIMVYNRHSLSALYIWIKHALLRGRPWRSVSWCIQNCLESSGTKAFTRREVRSWLSNYEIHNLRISSIITFWDKLDGSKRHFRWAGKILTTLLGGFPVGWFLTVQFNKGLAS